MKDYHIYGCCILTQPKGPAFLLNRWFLIWVKSVGGGFGMNEFAKVLTAGGTVYFFLSRKQGTSELKPAGVAPVRDPGFFDFH